MRDFEKISFEEFKKDICDDKELYDSYELPYRSSSYTAGYDFVLINDVNMKPGEIVKIPTGIKAKFEMDEVLFLIVRSGTGFKYNIRLVNQVGVIDADYYNNPDNEGHIWIKLHNQGTEAYIVNKGDKICQGIFTKFLTVDNEEKPDKIRESGFGSTNKEE